MQLKSDEGSNRSVGFGGEGAFLRALRPMKCETSNLAHPLRGVSMVRAGGLDQSLRRSKAIQLVRISGGIANTETSEAHAVSAICDQTNAVATFRRLLQENGAAQQLYGLLGLQVLNAPEFKTALPQLLNSNAKVRVLSGCIVGEQEVGEVVQQIQNRQWRLRSAPVPGGKDAPPTD